VVGDYHTHGDYSVRDAAWNIERTSVPGSVQDDFSNEDRGGIRKDGAGNPDYRGYLGTPSGKFKEYNPQTGTTRTIN
jgi:hypothetical protein